MTDASLIELAIEVRDKAYTPYSKFKVGAVVLTKEGKLFTGCNIESVSYSPTICAERVAISKAISEGYGNIETIAIVGSLSKISYPCGVCRQFIREFGENIRVIVGISPSQYKVHTLKELLPYSFGPEAIK